VDPRNERQLDLDHAHGRTRRVLERAADAAGERRRLKVAPVRKVGPGTVLLREWGGANHQVTVFKDGVLFQGKCYRSLSEVARVITGSRWSGPLFFDATSALPQALRARAAPERHQTTRMARTLSHCKTISDSCKRYPKTKLALLKRQRRSESTSVGRSKNTFK
jgi:hypothetical protein